jgi:hypothetical protein
VSSTRRCARLANDALVEAIRSRCGSNLVPAKSAKRNRSQ